MLVHRKELDVEQETVGIVGAIWIGVVAFSLGAGGYLIALVVL